MVGPFAAQLVAGDAAQLSVDALEQAFGGLVVVAADDLDQALVWARKLSQATTLPIEVRPFAE